MKNSLLRLTFITAALVGSASAFLSGCNDDTAQNEDAGVDAAVHPDLSGPDLSKNIDAGEQD